MVVACTTSNYWLRGLSNRMWGGHVHLKLEVKYLEMSISLRLEFHLVLCHAFLLLEVSFCPAQSEQFHFMAMVSVDGIKAIPNTLMLASEKSFSTYTRSFFTECDILNLNSRRVGSGLCHLAQNIAM